MSAVEVSRPIEAHPDRVLRLVGHPVARLGMAAECVANPAEMEATPVPVAPWAEA